MFWNEIQKDWKSLSKSFKTKWPKLTDADLSAIAGNRDELLKRLGKILNMDKAKLEKEVDDFVRTLKVKT